MIRETCLALCTCHNISNLKSIYRTYLTKSRRYSEGKKKYRPVGLYLKEVVRRKIFLDRDQETLFLIGWPRFIFACMFKTNVARQSRIVFRDPDPKFLRKLIQLKLNSKID